jgi:hypothetical protein
MTHGTNDDTSSDLPDDEILPAADLVGKSHEYLVNLVYEQQNDLAQMRKDLLRAADARDSALRSQKSATLLLALSFVGVGLLAVWSSASRSTEAPIESGAVVDRQAAGPPTVSDPAIRSAGQYSIALGAPTIGELSKIPLSVEHEWISRIANISRPNSISILGTPLSDYCESNPTACSRSGDKISLTLDALRSEADDAIPAPSFAEPNLVRVGTHVNLNSAWLGAGPPPSIDDFIWIDVFGETGITSLIYANDTEPAQFTHGGLLRFYWNADGLGILVPDTDSDDDYGLLDYSYLVAWTGSGTVDGRAVQFVEQLRAERRRLLGESVRRLILLDRDLARLTDRCAAGPAVGCEVKIHVPHGWFALSFSQATDLRRQWYAQASEVVAAIDYTGVGGE